MLKALADESRWRIVKALLESPMTIGEAAESLGMSQYNVSKHVRILKEAGIVASRREGKHVRCEVAESFRKRLTANRNLLDLGCCTFRFD